MMFGSTVDKYLIDQFAKLAITHHQNRTLNDIILLRHILMNVSSLNLKRNINL